MGRSKGGRGEGREATSSYAPDQRAFLVTLHYLSGGEAVSFVTVQAARNPEVHRFGELSSALDYRLSVAQPAPGEAAEP